ncbi:MAG: metallophosphoesterase [Oscillospiraceae bacterium]|nr:metallophosphoesterase [Oscillospiraceae bacterium]
MRSNYSKHNLFKSPKSIKRRRFVIRALLLAMLVILIFLILEILWFSTLLEVTFFELTSDKIESEFRIALVADHHGTVFGENQEELLQELQQNQPDLILLAGDIFCHVDKTPELRVESHMMISGAVEIAPTYFVSGNHEQANPQYWNIRREIIELGAIILNETPHQLEINGNNIILAGQDIDIDYTYELRFIEAGTFKIMLTHFPERVAHYEDSHFDVLMAGHAHGGQVRLPLIASNGLFAPGQGLFPRYTGGINELDDGSSLIVSRGLSRRRSARLRAFNRPELMFIDIVPDGVV